MHLSVFVLLVTLSFSPFLPCKNKNAESNLPPETQTGANTFGCRSNGRAWVLQASKPGDNNNLILLEIEPVRQVWDGLLYVRINNYEGSRGSISLFPMLSTDLEPTPPGGIDNMRIAVADGGYNRCQ